MAILRKNNKERYTTIPMEIVKDERLSLKDIGLLVSMLSLPDNWEFSENGLDLIYKNDGITSIRTGLKKLEECGYLVRTRTRTKDGRMSSVEWYLYERPQLEKPQLENPSVEKPVVENQPQSNTNISNTKLYNTNIYKEKIDKKEKPKTTKKEFVPPTFEQVLEYAKSRGREDLAKKFYDYFTAGEWVDSKGQKVRNWKQKFITWEGHNAKSQMPTEVKSASDEIRDKQVEELLKLFGGE